MRKFIVRWVTNALSLTIIAFLFEGVQLRGFATALGAALVLGLLNMLVRPVLLLLTLPINLMTLGVFTLVLNGFILKLADVLVDGLRVQGFMTAVLASITLTFFNMVITRLARPDR